MSYTPTLWVDDKTYATAEKLNKIEAGIADVSFAVEGRPAIDIREYVDGLDFTGATDDSAKMVTAIDGAVVDGRKLYLPGGTLAVGGATLKSGLHMVGDPGFRTRLILPALDYVGAIFGTGTGGVSADDIVLEDIFLDGQQQLRSVSCANALLKAYKAKRWTLRRVKIANCTSYGIGWQGYPGASDPNKQDVATDLLMEQCRFTDNGWIGGTVGVPRSGTNNSSDNIDIKSSERVVLNHVYSAYSSDPCFDIRGRRIDLIGCVAEGGQGAGFDLDSHRPGPGDLTSGPDNDTYITVHGGAAKGNQGSGVTCQSTTGQSDTHVDLIGFQSTGNAGSGYANNAPAVGGNGRLSVIGGKYIGNAGHGLAPTSLDSLSIVGAAIRGNGGDGIYATNQDGGTITGNSIRGNTGVGVRSIGTSNNMLIEGNDIRGNTGGQQSLAGAHNRAANNVTDAAATRSVASAASITLPTDADLILITGASTISNIARSYIGRVVRLWFAAALTVQHANASILLNGDVSRAVAGNDILELVCINANYWREVAA